MKKILLLLTTIFIIFLLPVWAGATNYYIDPNSGTNGVGSFADPFNTWTGVTISAGNDYRQKAGTTWTGTITITASGIDGNRILIGAYYDDGGVVHEDTSPSYGVNCGNAVAKPIITDSDNVGSPFNLNANYVELNSIQIKEGQVALYVNGSYNYVQYCRIGWGYWAIRVGLSEDADNNYIGYNYVYTDAATEFEGSDGIQLGRYADYNLVNYNTVDGFEHSAILTSYEGASHNEICYNKIFSHDDKMDISLAPNGSYNKYHHNYMYDAGIIQMISANYNEVYYNIIDGVRDGFTDFGFIHIALTSLSGHTFTHNKVYNNIMYDQRDDTDGRMGIFIYAGSTAVATAENNEFINNIALNMDTSYQPFRVTDSAGIVDSGSGADSNIWKNNLAYGYSGTYYAHIEGTNYADAAAFNARSSSYAGNLDTDPGLANPANSLFYPDAAGDSVVDSGFDVGSDYRLGFLSSGTDLTAFPMVPVRGSQYDYGSFEIGSFIYPDDPGGGGGGDFGSLTFMWDCEEADGDFTADSGTKDYSAGDKTGTIMNSATIDADAHHTGGTVEGASGIDADGSARAVNFTSTSIWNGNGPSKVGMWCRWPALTVSAAIFYAVEDVDNSFNVRLSASNEIRATWEEADSWIVNHASSGLGLAVDTWYYVVIETDPANNVCDVYVNDARVINYVGSGMSGHGIAPVALYFGDYAGIASADVHIDDIKISSNLADGLYSWRNMTDYTNDGVASAPTITDMVIINDIDGTPSVTANPTATWSDATPRYIGLKVSEQLINVGRPDLSRGELDAGPTATDYTWVYYNRQMSLYGLAFTGGGTYEIGSGDTITGATSGATATVGTPDVTSGTWGGGNAAGTLYFSSQTGTFEAENLNVGANNDVATIGADSAIGWYIAIKYIPEVGDRSTDLSFASTAAYVLNTATLKDGDGNPLDMTLPRADIGGTGAITLAIPSIFTVGTDCDYPLWSDGSTGFHDLTYDVDGDEIRIKTAHTDEYEISADNVRLRGTGGNLTVTGGLNLLGDDTVIRCLTFSGGITDNGKSYTHLETCVGSVIE